MAAERQAWVLATTTHDGATLEQPRADALSISRRLMAAGFDVARRENADPQSLGLTEAVSPLVVLYFTGPVQEVAGETWLLSGAGTAEAADAPSGWPLAATVRALREAGAQQVVAIIEGCHVPQARFAPLPAALEATTGAEASLPEDVLFLFSTAPDQACAAAAEGPRLTERVTKALATPGADFLEAFAATSGQGWLESRLAHRLPPLVPALTVSAGQAALPQEEIARLQAAWQSSGHAPVVDLAIRDAGTTAPPASGTRPVAEGGSDVSLITVSASARLAARPTPAGRPRPSVIVGLAEGAEAAGSETGDSGSDTTALREISRSDRLALRAADPAEFETLVDSGAFDPDPAALVAAVQTELQAANCYRGRVDGRSGPGTRRAVESYFNERKAAAPATEPNLVLYRAILAGDPVTCPAPAVAASRPASGNSSAGNRPRGNSGSAARPAASSSRPAATQTAPAQGGINANSVGLSIR